MPFKSILYVAQRRKLNDSNMYKGGHENLRTDDDDDNARFGSRANGGGSSGYHHGRGGTRADDSLGPRGSSNYEGPRARGYSDGATGYGTGARGDRHAYDERSRMMMANRRMEESSARSLRVLNETMRIGIDTTEELERQAESLDKTERRLDEMHVDLDKGERNLRKIKSPFGGISNYFSRKKTVKDVTDPKDYKEPPSSKSRSASAQAQSRPQRKQQQAPPESTGNDVVDRNLDEMEKGLHQLKGVGEMMGRQLDDSDKQLDRVAHQLNRNHKEIEELNEGIRKELYK